MPSAPQNLKRLSDPRVLLLFGVLLIYILWPIVLVLTESIWTRESGFTLEAWRGFVERGHGIYALRSVGISLATVLFSGVLGTGLAFFYTRLEFPGRRLFSGLTLLPFTLPPLVGVFAIWTMTAEGGVLEMITGAFLSEGIWFEKGYGGVLLVHTYSMFVYFFVLVGAAISDFDESQIEASRDLGASTRLTYFRVVLPQMLPAFTGAALLAFMTSMASFTAPFFYMAGEPVLTVGIQQAIENFDNGLASADCVVLALTAGIFLYLIVRFERNAEGGSKGSARVRTPIHSRLKRWGATMIALGITLTLLLPHLSMLRESVIKPGTGFVGKPVEYWLGNYQELFRETRQLKPILNSLQASTVAAIAVVLFSLISSWMVTRRPFPGVGLAGWLIMLPWALPGTVIGVGLLWISREPSWITAGQGLRGTLAILALAYFIRLLPLGHRTLRANLMRIPEELESAARDLGAVPFQAFWRITLPLLIPAVLAAATLTFVTAMGEFVSSILLTSHSNEPIAVKIDQIRRGPGGMQIAAAYSVLLTMLITISFVLFGRRSAKSF